MCVCVGEEVEGVWPIVWDHCTQGGEKEGAQGRTEKEEEPEEKEQRRRRTAGGEGRHIETTPNKKNG